MPIVGDSPRYVNADFPRFRTRFPEAMHRIFRILQALLNKSYQSIYNAEQHLLFDTEGEKPTLNIQEDVFGKGLSMAINVKLFAGQNWVIIPAALAVNEAKPTTISDQKWQVVLTGVCVIDFEGNNAHDWRRDTLTIYPDIQAPLDSAINQYRIPRPVGLKTGPYLALDQWAPFAAVSSSFEREVQVVDSGFSVDQWRPTHFSSTSDASGNPVNNVFNGIDVDIAVRNNKAVLHRVSYHITLIGRIVFLVLT